MLNLYRNCRRISMNISKVGNQTSSQDPQAVNSRSVTQSNLKINASKSEFLKYNIYFLANILQISLQFEYFEGK
jgi:hypothetical protein